MKNSLILLSIIIFSYSSRGFAQSLDSVYSYPVRPGKPDWVNLKTEKERFNALQIPNDLLKNMSTESLMISCINFPLFGHFAVWDSQIGMRILISRFNGLRELLTREDAPLKLLEIYQTLDTTTFTINKPQINNIFWSIRRCYFELLLAQDEILDKMEQQTKDQLLEESRRKIYFKIDHKNNFSPLDFQPTLLIMAKVLDKSSYKEFQILKESDNNLLKFIETGRSNGSSIFISLIELTNKYLTMKGL